MSIIIFFKSWVIFLLWRFFLYDTFFSLFNVNFIALFINNIDKILFRRVFRLFRNWHIMTCFWHRNHLRNSFRILWILEFHWILLNRLFDAVISKKDTLTCLIATLLMNDNKTLPKLLWKLGSVKFYTILLLFYKLLKGWLIVIYFYFYFSY